MLNVVCIKYSLGHLHMKKMERYIGYTYYLSLPHTHVQHTHTIKIIISDWGNE